MIVKIYKSIRRIR